MGGFRFNNNQRSRGVTLIELLVTLTIIFILASVALPIGKVSIKRTKELELRQGLRLVRVAIDKFQQDWARDGNALLGPLCVKNQLSCKENTGLTGYPKELETLLKIELTGAQAQTEEAPSMRRYLRRVPVDPMTGTTEWGLRCYQDEQDEDRWCGEDVFDIFSTSQKTALDGTRYRDW